jgi:3-hydroxyacyl-[acyl-carrier-protein] dehydratase
LRQSGDKRYSGTFVFDSRDPVFADHFPGNPVVPGSLIVQAFLEAAREFAVSGEYHRVERFRFKRFVGPGEYAFVMEQIDAGCLKCTLNRSQATVATGRLRRRSGSAGRKTGSEPAPRSNGLVGELL